MKSGRAAALPGLRAARIAAHLSQDRLAQLAVVDLYQIQIVEGSPTCAAVGGEGTFTPAEANRVADALGVSLVALGQALL